LDEGAERNREAPKVAQLPLADAIRIAEHFVRLIEPDCERVMVVGSVRRKRPVVHDIDVVAVPVVRLLRRDSWFGPITSENSLLHQTVDRLIHEGVLKVRLKSDGTASVGDRIALLEYEGVPTDLYYADTTTWGGLLQVRTGSTQFNIMLATHALRMGLKFHGDGTGISKDGQRIDDQTEPGIFAVLGMRYYTPEEREIP